MKPAARNVETTASGQAPEPLGRSTHKPGWKYSLADYLKFVNSFLYFFHFIFWHFCPTPSIRASIPWFEAGRSGRRALRGGSSVGWRAVPPGRAHRVLRLEKQGPTKVAQSQQPAEAHDSDNAPPGPSGALVKMSTPESKQASKWNKGP